MTTSQPAAPVLAIELSQRSGGVAVIDSDGRGTEVAVAGGRRDRDEVAPALATALADAGVAADALRTVAVDVGPGGFTGLRISVAIGQALAEAVGAQVVAVPGALVAAGSTPEIDSVVGRVLVLSAAKAGSAWGTLLERSSSSSAWTIRGRPGIVEGPPDEALSAVLADEHLDATFRGAIPGSVPIVEPRFSALGLGRAALAGGADVVVHDDPARLQPLYPREPEAVRIWRERRADNRTEGPGVRPG